MSEVLHREFYDRWGDLAAFFQGPSSVVTAPIHNRTPQNMGKRQWQDGKGRLHLEVSKM